MLDSPQVLVHMPHFRILMHMVARDKPDSDRRGILLCYVDDLVLTSHKGDREKIIHCVLYKNFIE